MGQASSSNRGRTRVRDDERGPDDEVQYGTADERQGLLSPSDSERTAAVTPSAGPSTARNSPPPLEQNERAESVSSTELSLWPPRVHLSTRSLASLLLTLLFGGVVIWFAFAKHTIPWHPHRDHDEDPTKHLVVAQHGAVSSEVGACSQIGVDIMKFQGGTAVDAAIATALCIGTVNMFASGIGGGGFMVIRHPNGSSVSVNFRETAPAAAHKDMYNHDPMLAQVGGLAAGVPGEIAGFYSAWKMYGSLPWKELFKPAIKMNRDGFRVTEQLAKVMHLGKDRFEKEFGPGSEWSFLLTKNGKRLLRAGEVMKRPALAKTLETIANEGWRSFYDGQIAEDFTKHVRKRGGIMTKKDMEGYTTIVEETLKAQAFGNEIITCPAPCSGPVLVEGVNIAEGLNMSTVEDGLTVHRVVETMKWLSAGRTELGDPYDSKVDNKDRVAEIQSKEFAANVRQNISDDRTYGWEHYNPSYEFKELPGTSHLSALDEMGMAVALTTTVNLYFGAGICDPVTGIVINSQMDDFSIPGNHNAFKLQPSIYNYVKPGKRPLSSMAPTITVLNGFPSLIIGGSGGSRIVTSVFLSFVKMYKWGYDLLDTIHSPRVHHQLVPEVAFVEKGFNKDSIAGLEKRGHIVNYEERGGSVIQAIHRRPDGQIHAVADWWRKKGAAAGY